MRSTEVIMLTMLSMARKRFSLKRFVLAAALTAFVGLSAAAPIAQQQPPQTPAQEGFVPVTDIQAKEQIPAAPLVMAGYAVAWLAVFVYVWSVWQRLGKVEREIADVSRRVAAGGRR